MCNAIVQMHIADFAYPREVFKVWCHTHHKHAPKHATHFRYRLDSASGMRWIWRYCAIAGPKVHLDANAPNEEDVEEVR